MGMRCSRQLLKQSSRLCLLLLLTLAGLAHGDDFLAPEQAFRLQVLEQDAETGRLLLHFDIADGYYLYRDQFAARPTAGGTVEAGELPAGEMIEDMTFGPTSILRNAVQWELQSRDSTAVDIVWQGCADGGLCYPPQQHRIEFASARIATTASGNLSVAPAAQPLTTLASASESRIFDWLQNSSLLLTLPVFFLLGVALTFTPCVLPMVPILSSLILGRQVSTGQALRLTTAFVLPMAATYALLGAVAALLGAQLQAILQNIWVIGTLGGLFLVLALAMFGIFTLQLPSGLRTRLDELSRGTQGGTYIGAALLGVLSALLVGPCMTAPLAAVLLYVAQTGDVSIGTGLLFSMGLGMGLPLMVIGTLGARYLPRPGPWMDLVKAAFGFALLATGIWMLERVLPAPLVLALWGVLLLALGLSLAHLATTRRPSSMLLLRTLGVALGIWGGAQLLGASAGAVDPLRPLSWAQPSASPADDPAGSLQFEPVTSLPQLQQRLQLAQTQGQAVMVDFTADWCVYCKVIERDVYTADSVLRSTHGITLLQIDVTDHSAEQRALMRHFQIAGPPTVMVFNPQGQEQRQARLVGAFDEQKLLDSLALITEFQGYSQ